MKNVVHPKLAAGRVRSGAYASSPRDGLMGAFIVMGSKGVELGIISSGVDREHGWEHVSVSAKHRTPNWSEMCWVKDMFWGDDECVVQYHPPRSEYVNHHQYTLHLWRPIHAVLPTPPSVLVGPKMAMEDANG